jgi:hypothetical protein
VRIDGSLAAQTDPDRGDAPVDNTDNGLEHVRRGDDRTAGHNQIIVRHD